MGPGPSGRDPRSRGCLVVLGIAGALLCIVGVALALSCRGCLQIGEAQGVHKIVGVYRLASIELGLEHTHEADLRQLEQLGDRGEISLVAFGILYQRFNDALVNDGRIDADELHLGMELVHDIVLGHGSVDMNHYPAGR